MNFFVLYLLNLFITINSQNISQINMFNNSDLFEGDIAGVYFQSPPKGVSHGAVSKTAIKWLNGEIPYVIDPVFQQPHREIILKALKYLMEKTKLNGKDCIKLIPRTNQIDYVKIVNKQGCWSNVGKSIGMQEVSIQIPGCLHQGVIVHEFLHALGIWHEQSRPDRDNYVAIAYENIQNGMEYNFEKYKTTEIDSNEPYDYESIMHYPKNAFSKNGKDTIIKLKRGSEIGNKNELSQIDISEIRKLYNCQQKDDCLDKNKNCSFWAKIGECEKNPNYMLSNCCKSCKTVDKNTNDLGCFNTCDFPFTIENKKYNSCVKTAEGNICKVQNGYKTWTQNDTVLCPTACVCNFPFKYNGKEHKNCIYEGSFRPWCSLKYNFTKIGWMYCLEKCNPNPCMNNGECLNYGDTYKCVCKNGFTGKNCESSDSNCSDKNDNCSFWAKSGECDKNPNYMLPNCCKSCKSNEKCNNQHIHCNYWASIGECKKNPNYMLRSCCMACKAKN